MSTDMTKLAAKYGSETIHRIQLYNTRTMMTVLILCLKRKGISILPQELFLQIASFIPICKEADYLASFTYFLQFGFVMPETVVYNSAFTLLRALPPNRLNKSDGLVYTTLQLYKPVSFISGGKKDYRKKHTTGTVQRINSSHPKFALYAKFIKSKVVVLEQWIDLESKNLYSLHELLEEQTEQACTARFKEEIHTLQKTHQHEMAHLCSLQTAEMKRSAVIQNDIQRAIVCTEKTRYMKAADIHRLETIWEL